MRQRNLPLMLPTLSHPPISPYPTSSTDENIGAQPISLHALISRGHPTWMLLCIASPLFAVDTSRAGAARRGADWGDQSPLIRQRGRDGPVCVLVRSVPVPAGCCDWCFLLSAMRGVIGHLVRMRRSRRRGCSRCIASQPNLSYRSLACEPIH